MTIKIFLGRKAFKKMLWWRQQGLCFYCHRPMNNDLKENNQPGRRYATFEHLIRRDQGGSMSDDNIVLCCYRCNIKKNDEYQQNVTLDRKEVHNPNLASNTTVQDEESEPL